MYTFFLNEKNILIKLIKISFAIRRGYNSLSPADGEFLGGDAAGGVDAEDVGAGGPAADI